jgi:dipeptidyl aminopeptidase/acylaminoacyl peptidase
MQNRRIYAESSPISYATADRNHVRFLLFHGSDDKLVDPPSQSGAFLAALTRAGFFARLIMIPGAGHYWASAAAAVAISRKLAVRKVSDTPSAAAHRTESL